MAEETVETPSTDVAEEAVLANGAAPVEDKATEAPRTMLRRRSRPLDDEDLDLDDDDFDDDDDDEDYGRAIDALPDPRRSFSRPDPRAPEAPSSLPEDRVALQEAARDQLFVPPPEPEKEAPRRRGRPAKVRETPLTTAARDRLDSLRLAQAEETASRQKALHDEFYDMMTSLDFGSSQHRIAVSRLTPEYDTLSGKRIVGHLETFPNVISPDEIRQKYGGGKYQLTLLGPKATGTGVVIKAKRTIEISGDPIIPEDPRVASKNAKQKEAEETSSTLDLVRSIVDAKDKDVNRAFEEARETKQLLLQTLASKNETTSSGLKDFLSAMSQSSAKEKEALLEERRLQEERNKKELEARLEERRLQEDRLKQEREERRQELEMLRLQHEKALETMRMENQRVLAEMQAKTSREAEMSRELFLAMQKAETDRTAAQQRAESEKAMLAQQQHEKMMEMMRLENQRILAELQARSSQEAQSSKEMLVFMQKMESEKTAQAQKQQEFALQQQMQNQQMLMSQMQQIDQTKTSLLMEALKEAKSRTDDTAGMLEKLVTMKQAFSALTTEPDNREPYEKFLDKAGEMAPGLVAAISSMRGSGSASSNTAATTTPAQPRVAPNSVAVVDLPPAPAQRALPADTARKKRPNLPKRPEETQKAQMRENPSTPPVAENKKEDTVQEVAATQSETAMNEFVYPEENLDLETSIKMFVQNMEIALHRDMPVKEFYEQVAVKFPQGVLSLLKLTTSDKCVEVLEQMAPDDWMINTPAGTQYVEELHEVLTSK